MADRYTPPRLVKTCRTFHLSNKLSWKDIKTRVEGVQFVDHRRKRAVMVFRGSASATGEAASVSTTLLGVNDVAAVRTCSLYQTGGADGGYDADREKRIIRALVKASGVTTSTRITASSDDLSVFRVDIGATIDIFRLERELQRRFLSSPSTQRDSSGSSEPSEKRKCVCVEVIVERELHDSLLITQDSVVWSISDSIPQKILASVEGFSPRQALGLVNRSRRMMGLF